MVCPDETQAFDGNDNFDIEGINNPDGMWAQPGVPLSCRRRIRTNRLEIRPVYDNNDVNPFFDLMELRFQSTGATAVRITFRKQGASPVADVSSQHSCHKKFTAIP